MECTEHDLITHICTLITCNLITRVLAIYRMNLAQSSASEQKCFDHRLLLPAPWNLWLLQLTSLKKVKKVLNQKKLLTEAERYEERHFVLHIQILTHLSLDRSQQTTLTSQQSHHYPGKAKKLGSDRVFGSIWKYRIQWFSWQTCTIRATGVNIECRRHELLGGSRGMPPPPRKFVELDSLKCSFLLSLVRNWVTRIMTGIISFFFSRLYALHNKVSKIRVKSFFG